MSKLEVNEMQKWLRPPLPHQKQIHQQQQQPTQHQTQQQGKANLQARRQSTDL